MLYKLNERVPKINGKHYFIADNATVIGSVIIENNVSIWFNTVIKADNDIIVIGENTNLQDGAVLHTDAEIPMVLEKNITVGHQAMLHGCTIKENSLIGIGAVILNQAVIGKNCIIGANSLIKERVVIPDNSLVVGSPGRVVRELTPEEIAKITWSANHYVNKINLYKQHLVQIK